MTLNKIVEEFNQCNKCGPCLATCPVCKELFLEKYTPRGKIQLAGYYGRGAPADRCKNRGDLLSTACSNH